jgi:hypothetical protein
MEEGWKTVFETDQEYQATIAKDILEDNGLKVVVMNQRDSAYLVFGSISVLVPATDEGKAINLLKAIKS